MNDEPEPTGPVTIVVDGDAYAVEPTPAMVALEPIARVRASLR